MEPLLAFDTTGTKLPSGKFDAVAVTSANAMRAAVGLQEFSSLLDIPAYAVGARTADAVKEAGFRKVLFSKGDAGELVSLLKERLKSGARVLHLSGEHRAREFSTLLAPAGITVETAVLYRMKAAAAFSTDTVRALEQGIDAVLHYSPRTAAVFVTLLQRASMQARMNKLRHLCLSEAVAQPILSAGGKTEIASSPDENALLALL